MRGEEIAMIFQDPMTSLNPTLTIGTQITETIAATSASPGQARRRAIELLEEVHIPKAAERLDDYPHRFSGGMRQRVMIAIAISCKPKLLIADEPTTALDVTVQAGVLDLLDELREEHGMAMIVITHDMGVVAEAADDMAVMYAGQIVEQARRRSLRRPEHPYTEALLGALPQLEGEGIRDGRLTAIPGRPPDLPIPRRPAASRRAVRTRGAAACATKPPELREIRPGHWVRSAHPASERRARAPKGGGEVSSEPLLAVTDLTKHFTVHKGMLVQRRSARSRPSTASASRSPAGQTLGLVGESGSGKSTTGQSVLQLIKPTSGSVRFMGQELTELPRGELRRLRREMQIVFQDPYSSLNPA